MRATIIAKTQNGETERVAISLQRDDGGSRIGRGELGASEAVHRSACATTPFDK